MFSAFNSVPPSDLQSQYLVVDESDQGTVILRLQDLAAGRKEKIVQVRRAIARDEYDLGELLDRTIDPLADDVFGN